MNFSNWSVSKRISLGFLLALAFLLFNSVQNWRTSRGLMAAADEVARTQEILSTLHELTGELQDIQNGARGFIITGDEAFLAPYRAGLQKAPGHLRLLLTQVRDPALRRQVAPMQALVDAHLEFAGRIVAVRRAEGPQAVATLIKTGEGQRRLDDIRKLSAEVQAGGEALLRQRAEASRAAVLAADRLALGGAVLALLLVSLLGYHVTRSITEPVHELTQGAEIVAAGDLSHRVNLQDQAEQQRDLSALRGLGHRLKSSARTVGAAGLGDLCEALELAGKANDWERARTPLAQMPALLERITRQVQQQLH